jgi:hypothetical protein
MTAMIANKATPPMQAGMAQIGNEAMDAAPYFSRGSSRDTRLS